MAEQDEEIVPLLSADEEDEDTLTQTDFLDPLPILAVKNTVLFPGIVVPITAGRDRSVRAINKAFRERKMTIVVLAQKSDKVEKPKADDLYTVGTIAKIVKLIRMSDGTTTVILQGRKRARVREITRHKPFLEGSFETLTYEGPEHRGEFDAMVAAVQERAQRFVELSPAIPPDAANMLQSISNPMFLANWLASHLGSKVAPKQALLEASDKGEKMKLLIQEMDNELRMLELKDQIESKVRTEIEKQQRDYFLNQQLKTIQQELGNNPQEEDSNALHARAKDKRWPDTVAKAFDKEFQRLRRMNPQVAEYSVQLSYLELMLDLPWDETSADNFDLAHARRVLDEDHFGLTKVKERIVEHLAVLKLKGDMRAPILCLVGPPGVGKTSLGKSIARALKREFVRMSLGGVHDESEIRGHRKTYIGAMPGRIIKGFRKAGTANPVIVLDEIDKIGRDQRGDPSSALLEVLDPEQNGAFHDNYLETEYDLSRALFIATANGLSSIQPALRDRMEIIEVAGYSHEEKLEIARRHLVPRQRKAHGLKAAQVSVSRATLAAVIERYTRESGVRNLDRQIAGLMRHAAKRIATEEEARVTIRVADLERVLGPAIFDQDIYEQVATPGVAVGLAWTSVGGDILFVECALSPGKGNLTLTGNLGDVMKESASTALSYLQAHAGEVGIDHEAFAKTSVHIHVPQGAIPKDGPSAGITMLSAIASAFRQTPLRPYLAMTGEITLRGKVLPVGGIKEKVLAARRAGIKEIMLCSANRRHVAEIEPDYRTGLTFTYVDTMREVLERAL